MTVEEIDMDIVQRQQALIKRPCVTCEPFKERLSGHVFPMVDDLGFTQYMTFTEDGRIIPIDEWYR